MFKKRILLLCLALLVIVSFTNCKKSYPKEMLSWLKTAKLGPYEESPQNWSEIEELAKKEGELIVYTSSSRISKVAALFEKKYPEIKVRIFDHGSAKTVKRTMTEHKSGVFAVDIVRTGGSGQVIYNLYNNNMVVRFIPDYLSDKINEKHKNPVLVGLEQSMIFMYNGNEYPDKQPLNNLWELTMPKWKGKFVIKNPLDSLSVFIGVATIIQHKKEMAVAYKELTGENLILSPGIKNAGYEFFHRLIKNDITVLKSGSKIAGLTGSIEAGETPISINNFSNIRYNESKGYVNKIFTNMNPASGIKYPIYYMIASRAKHVNAAKLFISFLMGSPELNLESILTEPYDEGKSADLLQGLVPYYRIGEKSSRLDVPAIPGSENWDDVVYWEVDHDYMWKESSKIKEFWLNEYVK